MRGDVRAILFDVYGTLFVSAAGDISIAREAADRNVGDVGDLLQRYRVGKDAVSLQEVFFKAIEGEKQRREREGVDYPEVVIESIWKDILAIDDDAVIKRFAVEYELIVNPVFPMPHAMDLLTVLKRKSYFLGIISNAQFYTPYLFSALMGNSLTSLGFNEDLLFFSYAFGYGKPSLFLFERAAERCEGYGVSRDEIVYVGNDMLKDIYPAASVGFQTVLFAGDGRSLRLRHDDDRCDGLTADLVITDLLQIMDYL
ncbi:MAG: HAD family hydrolase [Deltaproteobacteria bacterium]|nr:HAD family hydrolase [Deltaproteobacteria bacterium]